MIDMIQYRIDDADMIETFDAAVKIGLMATRQAKEIVKATCERMVLLSGAKGHEFTPTGPGGLMWTGFDDDDIEMAPTFLNRKGRPKLTSKDGKWLKAQIDQVREMLKGKDPLDAIGVSSEYFTGTHLVTVRWCQINGRFYVYNIPATGFDMVGMIRSEVPAGLTQISNAEWQEIIKETTP